MLHGGMARPREFDRDEALSKALEVFWDQGFEATSMSDLQRALGIGRQSLYNTFGDKVALFEEAITAYECMAGESLASHFGPDTGLESIRAHFHLVARRLTEGSPRRGCLLLSTSIERAPRDARIAAVTQRGFEAIRMAFAGALRRAQAIGEVASTADVDALAAVLTSHNAGMSVLAGSGASEESLRATADALIDQLVQSVRS